MWGNGDSYLRVCGGIATVFIRLHTVPVFLLNNTVRPVYEIIKNKTLMIKHVFHLTVNGQHFPMHSTTIASNKIFLIITATTTVLRPFFRDYPGEPVPEEKLLDFMAQGNINRGRHTDHPAGRHSIWNNWWPPPLSPHFLLCFTTSYFAWCTLQGNLLFSNVILDSVVNYCVILWNKCILTSTADH